MPLNSISKGKGAFCFSPFSFFPLHFSNFVLHLFQTAFCNKNVWLPHTGLPHRKKRKSRKYRCIYRGQLFFPLCRKVKNCFSGSPSWLAMSQLLPQVGSSTFSPGNGRVKSGRRELVFLLDKSGTRANFYRGPWCFLKHFMYHLSSPSQQSCEAGVVTILFPKMGTWGPRMLA